MTVEQAINGRNQDCRHYAECISVASLDPNAKGFICACCPDYEPQGGATRAKDGAARPPVRETMLFDMQPPFELRLVRVEDIDIDYEIAQRAVGKLSNSIEALGILQTVLLQKTAKGTLRVVGGRRRVLSAKKQGRSVPAMVFDKDVPEGTVWIFAAAENMMRTANPGFEAEALQNVLALNKWTIKEASEKLGFPLQVMKQRLKLTGLIPEMFHRLKAGTVTASQAKRIASLPEKEQERLSAMERLTSADIQAACRSNKLDALLEQEDLFEMPVAMRPNLRIIRDQMEGILASVYQVRGDESLLKTALDLVRQYEASLGGDS
jgi:ParB/RepB/Spo0J family partition protein